MLFEKNVSLKAIDKQNTCNYYFLLCLPTYTEKKFRFVDYFYCLFAYNKLLSMTKYNSIVYMA